MTRGPAPRRREAVRLGWSEQGAGRPIVLVHGVGIGGAGFRAVARLLSAERRVLVPDRRGYGTTAHPPTADLGDQVEDLARFLRERGLERSTFAGVSGGATLVLAFAIRYPELVQRALIHEPALGPLAPGLDVRLRAAAARMKSSAGRAAAVELVAGLAGADRWELLAPGWTRHVHVNARATRADVEQFVAFRPSRADLDRLRALAILTSVGDQSPGFRHAAAQVLERMAGASVQTVPGAAHLVQLEAPAAFVRLLRGL